MDIEISMKRTMDDLFSDMMTTVGQEITQFELRLRELIRSNPQIAQQFVSPGGSFNQGGQGGSAVGPDAYSAFQGGKGSKTLPWFKNGVKGFFRKLWYGDNKDNPDWKSGVGRRFGESFETGILTLNEYRDISNDVEVMLEGLFTEFTVLTPGGDLDKLFQMFRKNLFRHAKNYIGQAKRMILQTIEREREKINSSLPPATDSPKSQAKPEPQSEPEPELKDEPEPQTSSGPAVAPVATVGDKAKEKHPLEPQFDDIEPEPESKKGSDSEEGFSLTPEQEKAVTSDLHGLAVMVKKDKSGIYGSHRAKAANFMKSLGLSPSNPDHTHAVFGRFGLPKEPLYKRRGRKGGSKDKTSSEKGKRTWNLTKDPWGPEEIVDDKGNKIMFVPDESVMNKSFFDPETLRRKKRRDIVRGSITDIRPVD